MIMPKRKEKEKFAELRQKDCWHLYGLQSLAPSKFTSVVEQILQGKYILIGPESNRHMSVMPPAAQSVVFLKDRDLTKERR